MDKVLAGQQDLSYEIQLEVMPEFTPLDPTTVSLTRPVYTPDDAEVDEALGELASQNRTYESKTGKSAKAADGDMLVIDFLGRTDGVAFEGGSAEDAQLVLGSGQFIPGFEDQLIGAKTGDDVLVKVTFPEDYGSEALKGKAAEFEVKVKDVRAPVKTELGDDFAKTLGLDSLDALKDAVRGQIQQRYANQSRFKLKRALLDMLDASHDFPLPPRMVEGEFSVIWGQVQADRTQGNLPPEDEGKSEEDLQSEYRKIAERRVRLGLVLAELGRAHNVVVTDQELTEAARQEAMRYGPQAQEVFDYLRKTPQAQAQLRAPIYEDKVVDLVFGLAKVEDKAVSKDELMADDELPESYGGDKPKAKKATKAKAAAKADAADDAAPAAEDAKPAKAKAPAKPKAKKADTAE
jgi:trigger factor